jgi:hypothetical protein
MEPGAKARASLCPNLRFRSYTIGDVYCSGLPGHLFVCSLWPLCPRTPLIQIVLLPPEQSPAHVLAMQIGHRFPEAHRPKSEVVAHGI